MKAFLKLGPGFNSLKIAQANTAIKESSKENKKRAYAEIAFLQWSKKTLLSTQVCFSARP